MKHILNMFSRLVEANSIWFQALQFSFTFVLQYGTGSMALYWVLWKNTEMLRQGSIKGPSYVLNIATSVQYVTLLHIYTYALSCFG